MSLVDELADLFGERENQLRHISPSHLDDWITRHGGDSVADALKAVLIRRGFWRPWPRITSHRLRMRTEAASEDYRTSNEATKTLTLHATSPAVGVLRLAAVLGVALLPWAYSPTPMFPVVLGLAVLLGVPYAVQAIRLLRRLRSPDRVQIRGEQIVRLSEGSDEHLDRAKIAYIDIARHAERTIRRAKSRNPLGRLAQLSVVDAYVIYAMTTDGEMVILGDYIDENAAKAAVLVLEKELGLVSEPTSKTRVRAPESEDTERAVELEQQAAEERDLEADSQNR